MELVTEIGRLKTIKLLGKGKSGYSYLAVCDDQLYVFKKMHYEACPYYDFGNKNKVDIELEAYAQLCKMGIPVPKLICSNREEDYLVKEYIDAATASVLIQNNQLDGKLLDQLFDIAEKAASFALNIDYYPSNFVAKDGRLFYIDYEVNPYDEKWNLGNWGIYYWSDASNIDNPSETGTPIKNVEKLSNLLANVNRNL